MGKTTRWSRRFDEPIVLPDGRRLVTLKNAADHIMKLSKAEQNDERWQTAVRELMIAAERNGIVMLARAAMLRALNHAEPPPAPRKKRAKKYKIVR